MCVFGSETDLLFSLRCLVNIDYSTQAKSRMASILKEAECANIIVLSSKYLPPFSVSKDKSRCYLVLYLFLDKSPIATRLATSFLLLQRAYQILRAHHE